MFSVRGIINGEQESVSYFWENGVGRLEGDPMVVFLMEGALMDTTPVGPIGQYLDRDINDPLAALCMIEECFQKVLSYEGEIPQASDIPDGMIC